MTDIVQKINEQIVEAVELAVTAAISKNVLPKMDMPSVNVEKPREKNHGDFSCNVAMMLAKPARMTPRAIAMAIVENIPLDNNYIEKVEIAGPGFINFFINDKWLYDTVEMIMELGDKYGELDYGKGEKVMVEYVSANPTGPLHMGNARGGALGDLIANVLDKAGYDVTKEFYVNDAGNQIEKFALSLELRYLQELNGVDSVEFPEDCYQGADIIEHAKQYIASEKEDLSKKDSDYRKKKLVEYALPINIKNIGIGLKRYGIEFDNWFSELSLHESGEVDETIQIIKDNGFAIEKEGALWLKGEVLESEKDEVLVKSNGFNTYFAADLAYHRNKFLKRKFSRVIDLLGTDHHAHAIRMKNAMTAMGIDKDKLDLVLFQLVRLMRGGETVRMSKRTGKAVSLNDLLDEIGVDAARFFFNMKSSGSHLDFDLDLAVKQSNENPVFYVQYAHARICSMLRILEQEGADVKAVICPPLEVLVEKEEKALMKKLAMYPQEIIISAKTLEPGRLTRYIMDVAGSFHSFYNACRVKGEEESIMKARITLVRATLVVIKNVLKVVSITAPEKM